SGGWFLRRMGLPTQLFSEVREPPSGYSRHVAAARAIRKRKPRIGLAETADRPFDTGWTGGSGQKCGSHGEAEALVHRCSPRPCPGSASPAAHAKRDSTTEPGNDRQSGKTKSPKPGN